MRSDDEEMLSTISESDIGSDYDCSEDEDDIPILGTGCARCAMNPTKCRAFARSADV